MTDREFAKEALDYIRATINDDEHYFLSKKGEKRFHEFMSKYDDDEEEGPKGNILICVRKIITPLEEIKSIANDGYFIDGKKYSNDEAIAKVLARIATLVESLAEAENIAEDDDEAEIVEFESADDLVSKLFDTSES